MQGTIKTYLPDKHYGFVKGDDGREYFFHASDLINRRDESRLCEAMRLRFVPVDTPKGDRAKALALDAEEAITDTYAVPDRFLTSNTAQVDGWTIIEHSDWLVQGTSRGDPAIARRDLMEQAQRIGANGLIDVEYFKTTGSEPGTGSGTHHFTIHHYRGRAVVLGRRNALGRPRGELVGINAKAESYQCQLMEMQRQAKTRRVWWSLAAIGLFILMMFSDGPLHSLAPVYGLFAGAVLLITWHRYHAQLKASMGDPLFFAPVADEPAIAKRKRPQNVRHASSHHKGRIRSFVVDEGKLAASINKSHGDHEQHPMDRSLRRPMSNIDGTPMGGILDIEGRFYGEV